MSLPVIPQHAKVRTGSEVQEIISILQELALFWRNRERDLEI